MKRSAIFFSFILLIIDFIALIGAFIFSYKLRDKINFDPNFLGHWTSELKIDQNTILPNFDLFLKLSILAAIVIIVIGFIFGIYKIRANQAYFKELPKLILVVSSGIGVIILLSFILRTFLLPRLIILFFWIIAIIFLSLNRLIIYLIKRALLRFNIGIIRIGLLGENGAALAVKNQFRVKNRSGFELTKQYSNHQLSELVSDMSKNKIDQLLIVHLNLPENNLSNLRELAIDHHIQFTYIPNLFEVSNSRIEVKDFYGIPLIEVKPTPLDGWGRVIKRLLDIVLSLIALIILSPIFALTIILMKIFMPGPLIFKHLRVGIGNKPISIFKFRSIKQGWNDNDVVKSKTGLDRLCEYLDKHPDAAKEWQETQKLKNDPRVSKFGRFLRLFNIDELPQFVNVLLGHLSFVGPRPIIEKEKERYGAMIGRLLSVKPGITGLWQVSGRSDLTYEQRVALDVYYIENWSLWLDLAIIIKTIGVLISRKGAY